MSGWTAEPADLGWLLDEYKSNVEARLLAEQREQRTKARLDSIAQKIKDAPKGES